MSAEAQLRQWMIAQGLTHWRVLQTRSGLSRAQMRHLRQGQIGRLRLAEIRALAACLGVGWADIASLEPALALELPRDVALENQLLDSLEPFLRQWPAAVYAVRQRPALPASKLLPLLQPWEKVLSALHLEAVGQVGESLAFDPTHHQSLGEAVQPGTPVRVRYPGYRHRGRLWQRAHVSPLKAEGAHRGHLG
ncbi:MAG: helix-turn-helix domain-containing protein [Gloeomargaritaceae cyanobacterium C42_A2020_066]|nr:helix-turn-helix domain-containing protein [Gloeomargaritaceae cyanobacterium C42_A2020_066]